MNEDVLLFIFQEDNVKYWSYCKIRKRKLSEFSLARHEVAGEYLSGRGKVSTCNTEFTEGAVLVSVYCTLDDQTQMDSKPAGQPEHASLMQPVSTNSL